MTKRGCKTKVMFEIDGSDVRTNKATFLDAVYQKYGSNSSEYEKAEYETDYNEEKFLTRQSTYEMMRMYGCSTNYLL